MVFLEYNVGSPNATFHMNITFAVSATAEIGYILSIDGNASKTFFHILSLP